MKNLTVALLSVLCLSAPAFAQDGPLVLTEEMQRLQAVAEKGDADAQYRLGMMFMDMERESHMINTKYSRAAREWFLKAAEQGHVKSQNNMGVLYDRNLDYGPALVWFRKAAEQGDKTGQYNMGNMYLLGRGVTKDNVQAMGWFRKSAEQGFGDAQLRMGELYSRGEGIAKDITQALVWYRKAAAQGVADAEGFVASYEHELMEFQSQQAAANNGEAEAQYRLADLYLSGRGTAKDLALAGSWYLKAAEQGHEKAQYQLGRMYINDEKSIFWLRKSAEQGYAGAQFELGTRYASRFGKGVTQDKAQAVLWLRKALDQGVSDADDYLEELCQEKTYPGCP